MTNTSKSWIRSPRVTWIFAGGVLIFWVALWAIVAGSKAGEYMTSRFESPVEFKLRDQLGLGAQMSPRLKIFALDDSAFSSLGSWVLSGREWVSLFEALDKKAPAAVVIDAVFSKGVDFEDLGQDFVTKVRGFKIPIYVGGFVAPAPIRFRVPIDTSHPDFEARRWFPSIGLKTPLDEALAMPHRLGDLVYGPSPESRGAFSGIGHLMYDGSGTSAPVIQIDKDRIFPHVSLFLAQKRDVRNGRLYLDDRVVPLDEKGRLMINFPNLDTLYRATYSLKGLLNLADRGEASQIVQPGDVVLILPLMFTGNTDFKQSPFGAIPAGLVIAAQVNSILTGDYLRPIAGHGIFIGVAGLVGAVSAINFGVAFFWIVFVLTSAVIVGFSLYLFCFASIVLPWLFPLLAFVSTSLTIFARKSLMTERKSLALRQALEGVVPSDDIKDTLKHPERVNLEAKERVVTLMFIDVVGFSLIAENMLPRVAFENLKVMLQRLGETVHAYGGVIDKTLGDGLLCYFGYRFDRDSAVPDHAERAVQCARKIQEENLKRNLLAAETGEPVYPLRIGINTSACYMGDLGSGTRIDFTLVGNGVNFAKRLEAACDMHSVLMGATTYDLISNIGLPSAAMSRRLIQIKHHSDLVEAYEFDPFFDQSELKQAAIQAFRRCVNVQRVEYRWNVPENFHISVTCDQGLGSLINFSQRGVAVRLARSLAKGTRMSLQLDTKDGSLRAQLAKHKLENLNGEVRWGYNEDGAFVHGVILHNLSESDGQMLLQTLIEFAFPAGKGKILKQREPLTQLEGENDPTVDPFSEDHNAKVA